jgi:hypothetical protein
MFDKGVGFRMNNKLEGNCFQESSRLILTEHNEAILSKNEMLKKTMPTIQEEEWEVYFRIINESYYSKKKIKVSVFDEYDNLDYIGVVERIDPTKYAIKLDNVWMLFGQIIGVRDVK